MAQVDFSDFQKLDIRIGRVISAERVEGATKLLKLTVDFGQYQKQSIAGLGHIYDPEYFVGKQFAFVVNLKPKKIRGVTSECMMLAAVVDENNVTPLIPEKEVPDGCKVY
ncbi:MAG: methionine--tRNA ligase [Thaumarchaeota archaeon]|nr:methionine--tRNA ligase [Nitrososphaerota archaeon]RLG00427.1 MAG: methionine--tRNA ligase [Candidatus Wolframiiraptor sp.]